MLKILVKILVIICFAGCSSLIYHYPKQNVGSIMMLSPNANLYAYINLAKNRGIYSFLDFKYKLILDLVGNVYLSYTKEKENIDFSILIAGNFPRDIFWGMYNNKNFETLGNIFTNPKWKLKDSNLYLIPNKARTNILINLNNQNMKNNNILATHYVDELNKNEMFFFVKKISLLIPNQLLAKDLVPFNSGTLAINSFDKNEYTLKSLIKTNNPHILQIISKIVIPRILTIRAKITLSSPLTTRIKDKNTLEIEFRIQKTNLQELIANLISKDIVS